jgi:glycerol-3-phosphate acyltransferase PlsY
VTDVIITILLATAAYLLGGCPFSLWIGWWRLNKDIREFGDGNPGAGNVFRAGDVKAGLIAVTADIGKGFPFVFVAHFHFELPELLIAIVGISAILGHAFSPFLRFKGGKAIAVTGGVLLALPQYHLLLLFIVFIVVAYLFIAQDAWTAIAAPSGALTYLLLTHGNSWELLFALSVLMIFGIKQYENLKTIPSFRLKPIRWYQSRSYGMEGGLRECCIRE